MLVREPLYIRGRRVNYNPDNREVTYRLPIDAYVTESHIVITAAVTGLRADELEITMDDEALIIRGQVNGLVEDAHYVLRERPHGRFERRLTINVPVDIDSAEATYENGVLTLTLPKAAEARPHRITVKATN